MNKVNNEITFLGRSVDNFLSDKVLTTDQAREFPSLSFRAKLALVESFIIGPETDRFAAEPVYAVKGAGKLVSKGVEGIQDEIKLQKYIHSAEGLNQAIPFIAMIETRCKEMTHAEAV